MTNTAPGLNAPSTTSTGRRGPGASLFARVLSSIGSAWGAVEATFTRLRRRLRRQSAQLEAEAHLLAAEVKQLAAQLWANVDDIAFMPTHHRFTKIRTQFYGHGAFMGAAPALLDDPKWRRVLAFLMPDVFAQLRAAFDDGAEVPRVIPMMENNPVMAAYGVARGARASSAVDGDESPHHLCGLEWDLFVDQSLLREWDAAKAAAAAAAGDNGAALDVVMEKVIDTALIAHASSADTVQEQLGICQYDDVRKTPKTAMGGVEMDAWLDLFARALWLGTAADLTEAVAVMAKEARYLGADDDECTKHTFQQPWPVQKCVDVHRRVTNKSTISVIIEIKSLRSTAEFLSDVVAALNARGVHVAAVASFLRDEVRGCSEKAQRVAGVEHPGPREIQFFHYAGDLQHACDAGAVERGQSVMFNGASLLDVFVPDGDSNAPPVYSTKLGVARELETYRARHDLLIGLYVQEGDCDAAAAGLLSDLVAARPDTFALGFAWGGLRDEASLPPSLRPRLGYGSQQVLGKLGKAKQWREGDVDRS